MNSVAAKVCKEMDSFCAETGTYNANASSSYRYIDSRFNITYPLDLPVTGDFAADTLTIAGTTLDSVQFGIGYDTNNVNMLGIGYKTDDGLSSFNRPPSFPEVLVNRGLIRSIAYSLWTNDLVAGTGSILFGGVNTAQYTGELHTFAIPSVNGVYSQPTVLLIGLALHNTTGSPSHYNSTCPPMRFWTPASP